MKYDTLIIGLLFSILFLVIIWFANQLLEVDNSPSTPVPCSELSYMGQYPIERCK